MHLVDEPVVIQVPVRDQNAEEGRVGTVREPRDVGQGGKVVGTRSEWAAYIEDQPGAFGFHLDTAPAHLVTAAVHTDPHRGRW
ncbi:hypothetical protein Cph01nite_36780 [Cellulomonas phragmiteti]|uniref:DUF397 domain-containing protein n=1 Tax=Cellulomonas phragmiteti TaxID=478780 RepID=A0ABQ4DSH9_9CELL|nr:hypothetical protein Cph01nite_36780 [Cellulomonas phragmiteti]